MKTRIQNVRLVQDGQIRPVTVLIDGEKIAAVLPAGAAPEADVVMDGGGRYLSHGFLDIHTHGGGGHDFMDATEEAYLGAAKLHAAHGTTGLAVTTLAASKEEILDSFAVYKGAKSKSQGPGSWGSTWKGPISARPRAGPRTPGTSAPPNGRNTRRSWPPARTSSGGPSPRRFPALWSWRISSGNGESSPPWATPTPPTTR